MAKYLDNNGLLYLWNKIKSKFVQKEEGKGLSTNDLTATLKSNYDKAYTHSTSAHAPSNAQANVIETVKVNGVALIPTTKEVDVKVPTKVSELSNDSKFLTSVPSEYVTDTELNAKGYQNQSQVQALINNAVSGITGIEFSIVESLPSTGKVGVIYLISHGGTGKNIYDEYIWLSSGTFEKIGTTDIDLTPYLKKADVSSISNSEIDGICV